MPAATGPAALRLVPLRANAAAQVMAALRAAILDNTLPPDTRLSEVETAQHYGTSRQPVREAFIALAAQGLLDVRAQRGTFVTRISVAAVADARFVREAIEADIVTLLAQDPDPALITLLQAQLDRQAALVGAPPRAFLEADEDFHRILAEGAGKADAWRVIVEMKAQMDRVRYLSSRHFPVDRLVAQHRAVVEAIGARSPDRAAAAMRGHLRGILDDLPVIRADRPDYFT